MDWIDGHRHFFFGRAELDRLLAQLDRDAMAGTVLFGYHGMALLPEAHAQDMAILAFSHQYPGRILPFFCDLDLYAPDACEYIRARAGQGFLGMGELLLGHGPIHRQSFAGRSYSDGECIAAFRAAGECGLPVLAHADPPYAGGLLEAARRCPDTRFIWAHGGYDFLSEYGGQPRDAAALAALLREYPNLYFDLSMWKISPIYQQSPDWLALLEEYAERFVFGSDMSEDYLAERVWLAAYRQVLEGLSGRAQRLILGESLRALLP